jgi:hypothetical protein
MYRSPRSAFDHVDQSPIPQRSQVSSIRSPRPSSITVLQARSRREPCLQTCIGTKHSEGEHCPEPSKRQSRVVSCCLQLHFTMGAYAYVSEISNKKQSDLGRFRCNSLVVLAVSVVELSNWQQLLEEITKTRIDSRTIKGEIVYSKDTD